MRNYLSEMLYALTSAYSRKDCDNRRQEQFLETNIGKLFSIFAWGLNSVNEQSELIMLWDDLDNARGSVLDRYGANFGVKRLNSDDRFYRLSIKVKLMSQLSGGDSDTVIRASGALLDVDLSNILLEDVYPAKIALFVDKNILSQDRIELIEPIAIALKRIIAAGVGMRLYLRTYRTYRYDIKLLHCGYYNTDVSAPPPLSEDISSRVAIILGHGAIQTPRVVSSTPDTKMAHTARQSSAGGAVYHAHIKAKRID